jgi:hypothetical protein
LIDDGKAVCLFTAVYDGVNTWNQPVPINALPPGTAQRNGRAK